MGPKGGDKRGRPPGRPGGPAAAAKVIEDERFAAAQHDPRFQRFPRAKGKVEIDERFAGMFKDRAFQVRSAVDKRGRKVGKQRQKEDMRKYYRLENEEEDWGRKADAAEAELAAAAEEEPAETEPPAAKPPKAASGKAAKKQSKKAAAEAAPADAARAQPSEPAAKKQGRKAQPPAAQLEEASVSEPDSDSEDDSEPEFETEADRRAAERWARVRGLAGPETSGSSDESSADESEDSDEAAAAAEDVDLAEWGVGAMAGNPDEQVPEVEAETARLAVLDLDWSKVRAVDILAMLRSFLRKGQAIRKVTVYPSDYGLERMAGEARFGPAGLVDAAKIEAQLRDGGGGAAAQQPEKAAKAAQRGKKGDFTEAERAAILETLNEQDSDEEEDAEESGEDEAALDASGSGSGSDVEELGSGDESEGDDGAASPAEKDASEDDEVSRRKLQLYERSRLRYYYAIVECADVATAAHLYRECDGMEFEHSASAFDLRFVPDAQEFGGRQVRDEAAAVPSGYVAPDVGIAPMLHTRPKLSWDADADDRKKALSRRLTKEQLRDDDFKAYLGSESSEEEAELDEGARAKYSQLLAGGSDVRRAGGKDWAADASGSEEEEGSDREQAAGARPASRDRDMELQVTFGGGLDQLQQRLQAKKEAALNQRNDTVWQAYLRRRKEKRAQAKRMGRCVDSDAESLSDGDQRGEEDPFFRHDENAFDDPFFQDGEDGQGGAGEAAAEPPAAAAAADSGRAERKAKKQAAKAAAAAEAQRRAELELLLLDDGALQDASRLGAKPQLVAEADEEERPKGKLSRKARLAAKRAAKAARKQAGSDEEDAAAPDGGAFRLDVGDARFGELFTRPEFALDPTDPRFVEGAGTHTIMREASRRRGVAAAQPAQAAAAPAAAYTEPGPRQGDLKSLAASLKRKAGRRERVAAAAPSKPPKKARAG